MVFRQPFLTGWKTMFLLDVCYVYWPGHLVMDLTAFLQDPPCSSSHWLPLLFVLVRLKYCKLACRLYIVQLVDFLAVQIYSIRPLALVIQWSYGFSSKPTNLLSSFLLACCCSSQGHSSSGTTLHCQSSLGEANRTGWLSAGQQTSSCRDTSGCLHYFFQTWPSLCSWDRLRHLCVYQRN